MPDLAAIFARHDKAVLAFSGGKDSLVCLHLCRPYRDKLTVVWVNTGAMFPHMVEFVRKATEGFNYIELTSDQAGWIAQFGYPADVVPVVNSIWRDGGRDDSPRTLVQPWTACCAKVRFGPILEYLAQSGATAFIHGQRKSDKGGWLIQPGPDAKIEDVPLIRDWSDQDVFDYLAHHKVELPEQYACGVKDSLECWSCTALTDEPALERKRLYAYMAVRYPGLLLERRARVAAVFLATTGEFKNMKADADMLGVGR